MVTQSHNAMPVDPSNILVEVATAAVSFADIHNLSKDTGGSLADVYGSFVDIEIWGKAANRITLNFVVDAKVTVSDISVVMTLSGSSREFAEIMPISVVDAEDEFVTTQTFSDDTKEESRARSSSAFNISVSVVPLLNMQTSDWTASCMMAAIVEYDEHKCNFDLEYWEDDPNLLVESASGTIAGGYHAFVSPILITYDEEDILFTFGNGPGQAAQVLSLDQNESNGTTTEARVPPGAGKCCKFQKDHSPSWCHTICWRMFSTIAMLILLGMFRMTKHGTNNIHTLFWQLTILRRSGKLVWFNMLTATMQLSQVECASLTKKSIGQSTPIPGTTNRITATLISDTDLLAASGSVVTMPGLSTAIASNPMPLLAVSENGAIIFSDGTIGGHGVCNVGTLTLTIHSATNLRAGITYVFAFDITNPATANTSPTIYIEASGVMSIVSPPMTVPDLLRYSVRNGANPLQVEVPLFNTKIIQQKTQFAKATTWKVTLNSNFAFSSGSTVTISGLTGSQTPESASSNMTSTESKLGSFGDRTCSSGTLVLVVASGGTIAETDYLVTLSLPNWAPAQLLQTVKVMAAIQDSGSTVFADMTYTIAEATNSIVLSHSPPITVHRRSEQIVKIGKITTLPHHVKNRDVVFPAIIAGSIAPTEGPILKGSLVLLGISYASTILNFDIKSSLKFRGQDVDNDNHLACGAIVAGPLSHAHWKVAESPEYDLFVRNTANFKKGSSNLVKDYQSVVQSSHSFTDDVDGGVVALLAAWTPNWTNVCMLLGIFEYSGHDLHFVCEYWEADLNPQIESVRTQAGKALGMTAEGYPLPLSISGFLITNDMEDISIVSGSGPGREARVLLLDQSDSHGTTVGALVPPGDSGVVQVMVSNDAQGSLVSFEFEYLSNSVSEVENRRLSLANLDGSDDVFSAGSCPATTGGQDLSRKNIASLSPGISANTPSLE